MNRYGDGDEEKERSTDAVSILFFFNIKVKNIINRDKTKTNKKQIR